MRRVMLCAALAAASVLVATVLVATGVQAAGDGYPAAGPQMPAGATSEREPAPAPATSGQTEVEKRLARLEELRKQGSLGVGPSFQHVNDHENLRKMFRRIRDLIRGGQYARANTLGATLLPDEERLKAGLREGTPESEVQRILALEKSSLPDEVYKIFAPDSLASEVRLYRATTEELISCPKDTAAHDVFPKNAQKVARELLRPGITWWIVELAVPGQEQGFRYHLIFFDGAHWTMLGPIWAAPK